jgi:hypothetical protein
LLKLPKKPAQPKTGQHTYASSKKPARVRDFGLAHTTEGVEILQSLGADLQPDSPAERGSMEAEDDSLQTLTRIA